MRDKKSYNVLALRGAAVDDMEYVETYNLDPAVAYTPKINDVMLDRIYADNLKFYRDEGHEESVARARAKENMMIARRDIDRLLKG